MANTYEWVISSLNAKIAEGDLSNVIETVHWRLQATDGEHTADVYGSVGLELEGDFIPFEDLTQADIEAMITAGVFDYGMSIAAYSADRSEVNNVWSRSDFENYG